MSNHEFTNWTALPNGIVGDSLRLSVFVTPKLLGEESKRMRLADYQAILKWPETIEGLQLQVEALSDGSGQIAPPVSLSPANKGELGPSTALWNALFDEQTPVEPFSVEPAPASAAMPRRVVPVYYRAAPLQALVDESYAIYSRLALSELEAEPRRPTVASDPYSFDSPDALLGLAAGSEPALTAQQFALKEGNTFLYRPARTVTEFFNDDKLDAAAGPLAMEVSDPLNAAQIRELFSAFSLYHKRGVRNKTHQIRARRRWASTDPNFNFHSSETYQISNTDHGKDFEFAESRITIVLPQLGSGDRGFQVVIAYSPNQALPAPSNDEAEPDKTYRKEDEDPALKRYSEYLVVNASAGNQFGDGAGATQVARHRAKTITWDGARWSSLDRNELDFHSMLSSLTSFPSLMRRLGWVFDLELPVKDLFPSYEPGDSFTGKIKVRPIWADTGTAPAVASPWTMFAIGERSGTSQGRTLVSFSARRDPNRSTEPVKAGFRDLSPSRSFQYDLDAAVIKTVQKAVREADQTDRYLPSYRIEIPGSPRAAILNAVSTSTGPALDKALDIDPQFRAAAIRSTGISLYSDKEYVNFAQALRADTGRIGNFATRLQQSLAAPNSDASEIASDDVFLNDVTAGCIIDVHDSATDRWYSLCERQVVFEFDGTSLPKYLAPADEGWLSDEALVEIDEDGHRQLRINENFFRWDGWSLVAPNPSEPLKGCDVGVAEPAPSNIGLRPTIEVKPLSLPRLRFGRTYRFRARLADLAGNAWPREYADALHVEDLSSESVTYRRQDPINPPFLVPLQPPGPGTPPKKPEPHQSAPSNGPEKGEMLVIRSGLGAAYRSAEWLVMPPDVKFQEAEWIGMFDAFDSPNKAYTTLSRYCGALPDKFDSNFVNTITWAGGRLATPYLPDGHAKGAAFAYLPGGTERKPHPSNVTIEVSTNLAVDSTTTFDFALDMEGPQKSGKPFAQPFYLRLASGDKRKTERSGRRLTVTLPPGEQQLIRVSSTPVEDWNLFAQVHNAFDAKQATFLIQPRESETLGKADWGAMENLRSFFEKAIAQGQFWPLTPKKNLYLVHAVPKPLVASPKDPKEKPVFKFSQALTVEPRVTGGLATVLHDAELRVHRASTGRIDVYAEWDEHSDGPGLPVFPRKERRQHICFSSDIDLPDLTIAPDESHLTVDFAKRHEFPTTKHYAVTYHMVATTRYREYYDPQFTADSANITITSEKSDVFHILNTTPPPALEVVYVLPVLIWEDPTIVQPSGSWESPVVERKVRRGLRVYMRRNWFLSGEDERLGVVFAQKANSTAMAIDADPEHQVAVTQWGTNPIWLTKPLDRQPTVDDASVDSPMRFPGIRIAKRGTMAALATQRDLPTALAPDGDDAQGASPLLTLRRADDQVELPLEEIETVDVAAFPVYCDFDKDLDYADVEFKETVSYSPMVKMALARFQPYSAAYAHLSPTTNWVFQAVSPERVVAYGIVREVNEDPLRPTKQLRFTISGIGPGDMQSGYRENSLEVLLFDGETPVSDSQMPLSIPDKTLGFRIPMSFLEPLKHPTVQIKEFEHVGGDTPRLVFVYAATIDVDAVDQI